MRTGQHVYSVLAHDFLKGMATLLANPPLAMLAHSYCSWLAHMHICIFRPWPVVYIRAWSIYWPYRLQPTWLIHIDRHRPTRDLAFPVLASSYIHITFHQLPFDRLGELCFICYNIGQYATNTLAHCVAYTFSKPLA